MDPLVQHYILGFLHGGLLVCLFIFVVLVMTLSKKHLNRKTRDF